MRRTRTNPWNQTTFGSGTGSRALRERFDGRHLSLLAFVLAASLSLACHSSAARGATAAPDELPVVGYVAGTPVPIEALETCYAAELPAFAGPDGTVTPLADASARLRISERLIDDALLEVAAAARNITVSEGEIDALVAPDADTETRARVRRELLADRLAGVDNAPPSDDLVAAFYADNVLAFVPIGAASGSQPLPFNEVQEQIRLSLGASLRAARRDALRRELRATIPFTNEIAVRVDAPSPRSEDLVVGIPTTQESVPVHILVAR